MKIIFKLTKTKKWNYFLRHKVKYSVIMTGGLPSAVFSHVNNNMCVSNKGRAKLSHISFN